MVLLQWLLLWCASITHRSVPVSDLAIKTHVVHVGSTPVQLVQYQNGRGKQFVHVHRSETTARAAALTYIHTYGGSLLTLEHPGGRNITFTFKHRHYAFDPNRIFTTTGLRATLQQNSHNAPLSPAVMREVQKLANAILYHIPVGKVIAVHNNTETYSLFDYFPHHASAKEASRVYQNAARFYRNFFVVTKTHTFKRLKRLHQNVVLQAPHPTDDGSLSVRLRQRTYVNVEAGYHAFKEQLYMLRLA